MERAAAPCLSENLSNVNESGHFVKSTLIDATDCPTTMEDTNERQEVIKEKEIDHSGSSDISGTSDHMKDDMGIAGNSVDNSLKIPKKKND